MTGNQLSLEAMGQRLDIDILGAWMDAILARMETDHPETDWNLVSMLGAVMSFPLWLAPDNDDQPDD